MTEMDTAEVPEPIALVVFVSPSAGVHWNQHVVASPLGLTVPLNVAEVDVTLDAASVVTVGAAVVVLVAAGAYVAAMLSAIAPAAASVIVVIFHFMIHLSESSWVPARAGKPARARYGSSADAGG